MSMGFGSQTMRLWATTLTSLNLSLLLWKTDYYNHPSEGLWGYANNTIPGSQQAPHKASLPSLSQESGGEWIHVYVWLSPFAVYLKLSQHCVLIGYTPKYNKKFKKKSHVWGVLWPMTFLWWCKVNSHVMRSVIKASFKVLSLNISLKYS